MARIWMTGATGLVGSAIRHELVRAGHQLTLITKCENIEETGVTCIHADLSSESQLAAVSFEGADVFIHNAASLLPGQTSDERELLEQVNVKATEALFNAAGKAGVKTIIFTSSLSVISKPLPEVITEESPVHPVSPYALSKWKGEQLLHKLSPEIRKIVIRISSPVGQHVSDMPLTVLRRWIGSGMRGENIRLFGSGERTQDFVSVVDIARAFLLAVESKVSNGCFHIASGEPMSMKAVASLIASRMGVSVITEGEDALADERWNVCIDKARKELGFVPHIHPAEAISQLIRSVQV